MKWGERLNVSHVGELNEVIAKGDISRLILIQEALQEKKIAEIAEKVTYERDKKFVMIAGPSSSGKTSFSHRLSIQLKAQGMIPHRSVWMITLSTGLTALRIQTEAITTRCWSASM